MKTKLFLVVSLVAFGLGGCAAHSHKRVQKAEAKLQAKSGSRVKGTLYLEDHYGGVIISGKVTGLKPGAKHGFHVHESGDCSARDASSAGNHFAAGSHEQHGAPGSKDSHAGDLGNIEADKAGVANVNVHVKGLRVMRGDSAVAGRSLVIHADADDLTSQPAGNSGKRIACGKIEVIKASCCGDDACKTQCSKKDCKGCKECKDKKQCKNCKDKKKCSGCECKKCDGKNCKDCKDCQKKGCKNCSKKS